MRSIQDILDDQGPQALPTRRLLCLLAQDGRVTRQQAIGLGFSRRSFEMLARSLAEHVAITRDEIVLLPAFERTVREHADCESIDVPIKYWQDALDAEPASPMLAYLADLISRGPKTNPALDHVQATPETILRRAEYLRRRFDLSRSKIVMIGDHDLTSLALLLTGAASGGDITVVDIDDSLLRFISETSAATGDRINCVFTDLRSSLPEGLRRSADIVFTDPPYSPEGVGLFAARAIEALRDDTTGRLVLAYGYPDLSPGVGQSVQEEIENLRLIFDAVLPGFNRYVGAEAIASQSSLYELRLTRRTRSAAQRFLSKNHIQIYTHKHESVESKRHVSDSNVALATSLAAACRKHKFDDLAEALTNSTRTLWSTSGKRDDPVDNSAGEITARVVDVSSGSEFNLIREIIRSDAQWVMALVPNNAKDIRDEASQIALRRIVSPKYEVKRILRNTPDQKHALIILTKHATHVCEGISSYVRKLFESPSIPSGELTDVVPDWLKHVALINWPRSDIETLLLSSGIDSVLVA